MTASNPILVSAVDVGGRSTVLVYDLSRGQVIRELTDYAIHMADQEQLTGLTISKRIGQLVQFWRYLSIEGVSSQEVADRHLIAFRDRELESVLKKGSALGSLAPARRTVNDKLVAVLSWLAWQHKRGMITAPKVTSLIERGRVPQRAKYRGSHAAATLKSKSNVLFRSVGSASKHKTSFVASQETFDAVQRYFFESTSNAYVAHRNALIVEIANSVGFRRASINSLTVDQFDRLMLESTRDPVVLIRPRSQKFGYETDFPFPVWLGLRICDFCDQYRPLSCGKAKITCSEIFLSARNGKPMTDRAISQIVSRAMRNAGAPRRSSLHTFRAKFANDLINQELEIRQARGMDTSSASIAAAVALRMGHRNSDSLYAYVSAAQSLSALTPRSKEAELIESLQDKLDSEREKVEFLRRQLYARNKKDVS
ncbi:tyrosine-type recombinase/integrase [Variovorax sp. ZT5P49]|uniref:tyrosine-type recombinase/integrase n=1 Tax=Variovorax sp. ZT5P49 TaxID=3443733 RepID=UPI003F44B3DA